MISPPLTLGITPSSTSLSERHLNVRGYTNSFTSFNSPLFKPSVSGIAAAIPLIAAALDFDSFNLNLLLNRRRRHIARWNMADARLIARANLPT